MSIINNIITVNESDLRELARVNPEHLIDTTINIINDVNALTLELLDTHDDELLRDYELDGVDLYSEYIPMVKGVVGDIIFHDPSERDNFDRLMTELADSVEGVIISVRDDKMYASCQVGRVEKLSYEIFDLLPGYEIENPVDEFDELIDWAKYAKEEA